MTELILVSASFLALGLMLGFLIGHAVGVENERGKQIDKLTAAPR
jgi:hypothetical protein